MNITPKEKRLVHRLASGKGDAYTWLELKQSLARPDVHTWARNGFCIYCHNVHRTDHNARSTCSDGFTCRGNN